jgi:hypothetical protein
MTIKKVPLEVIEFENNENEKIAEASPKELQTIVSYNIANTVEVLKNKIDQGEIDLQPDFQREFVWDISKASLFIDSLLLGLPIPSIFLGKAKNKETYIVIDGQQRLKSFYYFIQGEFKRFGKKQKFILKNLKNRDWDGKTYKELSSILQRRIGNAVINSTIIEGITSKPKVIHDIFHRLNTGGMPLTDQEIRNCVYSGSFNKFIISLNNNKDWRKLLGTKIPDLRMRDIELILRFFALYYDLKKYKPSMREFLTNFQGQHVSDKHIEKGAKNIFDRTVKLISSQIGENAFKLTRTINKSVLDAVMVSIGQNISSRKLVIDLKTKHKKLLKDKNFLKLVSSSTTSHSNVVGRINLAKKILIG